VTTRREALERYFEFSKLNATWRTEFPAGATTFVTMAYIVFVNSPILGDAGMPAPAVMAATRASAGLASIPMGAFARYPIALAPGMGLNAYFTCTVVKGMGVSWQVALGAVFLSGLAFLLLTVAGVREKLFTSLPRELYPAVAVGIGLFIAFIGFRNAGLIVPGAALGLTQWTPHCYSPSEISATAFQLDIAGIVAGGRTGVTAITTGLLFLALLFVAPLAGAVPNAATAPALILVGAAMLSPVSEVPWDDPVVALPAFLTLTVIPLSFSIANGLAVGFTSYAPLKLAAGRGREVPWLVWLLAALFMLRFAYLGKG